MLSYRHAFHAGNHADVLKHFVLIELMRHLSEKDKAFWLIDTHAGAGEYALDRGYATKLAEYRDGIGRLWVSDDLPAALDPYLQIVRAANPDGQLRRYPGSPCIAAALLRSQDRLRLFELHPSDVRDLRQSLADKKQQVRIEAADGFRALRSLLPPPTRRALILIDPAYELADDYRQVTDALADALRRFATGVYAIWYPLLGKRQAIALPEKLQKVCSERWLNVALRVRSTPPDGHGMTGSGMLIVNPPWRLAQLLRETLPYLTRCLAQDATAEFFLKEGER